MCSHVLVLAPITTQNALSDVGFTKIRVQTVLVTAVGRFIGEINWVSRTLINASPRQIIAIISRRTVYDTHVSRLVSIKRRVLGTFGHASPCRVVRI